MSDDLVERLREKLSARRHHRNQVVLSDDEVREVIVALGGDAGAGPPDADSSIAAMAHEAETHDDAQPRDPDEGDEGEGDEGEGGEAEEAEPELEPSDTSRRPARRVKARRRK